MTIDIADLLRAVPAITAPGTRVGLPDDPSPVAVSDPGRFAACLDALITAFQRMRPGTQTLVSAEVNTYRKEVRVRILQNGRTDWGQEGRVEPPLTGPLAAMRAVAGRDGGGIDYWGGNNNIDLSLPYPNHDREDFPEFRRLPWDKRYRRQLERESWSSLRHTVFRYANLAAGVADRARGSGPATVLVPSVGICIHPWLFADRGLCVTATDAAGTAIAALSDPARYPNLYSTAAYERWDVSSCAMYAMIPHPDHFDGMPPLEDAGVRDALRERITFAVADWARQPVPSGSVDLVFATNAVPRETDDERRRVLEEWDRVLRPGGVAFVAQHHAGADWGVESFFTERGFAAIGVLRGESVPAGTRGGFQTYHTSG